MKCTDVTPEQLAHAEEFLQSAQGKQIGPRGERLYTDLTQLSLSRGNLIRLLAWYGAIRARSGAEQPRPLVNRTGPGSTMDFGTPEQLAEMPAPQPVGKIVLAAKDLSPEALDSGATAELVSGLPPLHFPLSERPNAVSDELPINCGTFTDQPLSRAETVKRQGQIIRKLYQRIDELEKSLAESRKHCVAWADQVSRAEGDRDIAPALSALNALHRVDIVNLLAQYDAVIEGRTEVCEEEYEPDPEDAAVVEDIRVRWTGSVL